MTGEASRPAGDQAQRDDEQLPLPWSIWWAVRLMWAGAALSVITLVVTWLISDSVKANLAAQLRDRGTYSPASLDAAYQSFQAQTAIVTIVGAGVWVWMAQANAAGRKWARLIATGLGLTTVVGYTWSFSPHAATTTQLVLGGINVALAACAIGLLWHPESSDYFWLESKRR